MRAASVSKRAKRRLIARGIGVVMAATLARSAIAQTPPPAKPVRFAVDTYEVAGNTILPADEVETLVYPFMGPDRTADDVEQARAALQSAFEKAGYSTVTVLVPEQGVNSGVIRLEVQEQRIGKVTLAGASRTTPKWIGRRAPSLKEGVVPDFNAVQRDIVALNTSADRRITPEVKAGVAPGTVDVLLKVEDHSPFHGSAEINNFASPNTSDLRVAGSLRYDDMFGRGDSLTVSTQFAPTRPSDAAVVSGNYLAHVGGIQLLAYGVHSSSDISVVGGVSVIGAGDVAGLRAIVPLGSSTGFYQSLTAGIDYKDFKEDLLLGADRDGAPITYVPATLSWRGDWTGDRFKQDVTLTGTLGIRGLGDDTVAFDRKRYRARPDFFTVRAELNRVDDIVARFETAFHLNMQWTADPLISNEQFSIGGMDSVRGYYESELLSDYGVVLQSELRSPPLGAHFLAHPEDLRLRVFFDSGIGAIRQPLSSQLRRQILGSAGVGATVKLFDRFNGALDVAIPLRDAPYTDAGSPAARFRVWGDF